MIVGYARVSTDGQSLDAQHVALAAAGAERVYAEKISGAVTDRKALAKATASPRSKTNRRCVAGLSRRHAVGARRHDFVDSKRLSNRRVCLRTSTLRVAGIVSSTLPPAPCRAHGMPLIVDFCCEQRQSAFGSPSDECRDRRAAQAARRRENLCAAGRTRATKSKADAKA